MVPPPSFRIPTAIDAMKRLEVSQSCIKGLQAEAKIDHFGKGGRFRGVMMVYAAPKARLRMDVLSPFGTNMATLTSDGRQFQVFDLQESRFFQGLATACNLAQFTGVELEEDVFVHLLLGTSSVLYPQKVKETSIQWVSKGFYQIVLADGEGNTQELEVAPKPSDRTKPWQEQQLRVLAVRVKQGQRILYQATFADHTIPAHDRTLDQQEGEDMTSLAQKLAVCRAEIPYRIHLEVPAQKQDILIRYDSVLWNPVLNANVFVQRPPFGLLPQEVTCNQDRRSKAR
ncbi:hypothetical protein [Pajaroellobacter abortibovis]|uniref:DUF4292 domain-containing protein n=1 Tax=Pajaroellobacter abortibovis TaxID=1882918 RepID=A0A1L6MXS6_9BACT|nr:hypothetical protein [Pajaroellobacter abortibovis]APS00289.1 hypothetical protein BCY86_06030 [Pajaroellobacter abortibovis]